MQVQRCCWAVLSVLVVGLSLAGQVYAEGPAAQPRDQESEEQWWIKPIPIPADPELEEQMMEVQKALNTIHQQMVRRKELINEAKDPAATASLYTELEALRKEREDLEALLHDLVEEARISEQTAIDEALARARWMERQQEYWEKKEELLRDRQE